MREKFLLFFAASVKGIAQVVFIENIAASLLILAAIFIHSIPLGFITIGSAVIGTLLAFIGGGDRKLLNSGFLGFNSILAGLAIFLNLEGPYNWIFALVGAGIAAFVTAALMHIVKPFDMPILTFPYILLTWFIISASFRLNYTHPGVGIVPQNLTNLTLQLGGTLSWHGLLNGIGQIFFVDSWFPALLFLLAIFIANKEYGIYTIIGSVIGWLFAIFIEREITLVNLGLYNYNAVLTMIAVASVFKENRKNAWITGIFAALLSIQITASLNTFLAQYGLPVLTMPFVLATWLVLAARKVFPNI